MPNQNTVSVLMPALNEQANIQKAMNDTLEAFDQMGIEGEVVVINDGSTDDTPKLVEAKMKEDPRVRMVTHETPHGFGASFWDGVDHARNNFVVVLPGDAENDPIEIFRYFKLLEHVDIVIPFVFNKEVRSLYRQMLSFTYRLIINLTFNTNLNYTNGTILYRRAILLALEHRSDSFFFQTDILIRLLKRGYLFAEVPYRLDLRETGNSKAVSFPSFVKVARGYLRLFRDQYVKTNKLPVGHLDDTMTASRYKKGAPPKQSDQP